MTRRQRTLLRYLLASAILMGVIALAVWLRESWHGEPREGEADGVVDVLARQLPADAPAAGFVDVAAEAGLRFRHFPGARSHRLPEDMGSGLAWGDCDGDGLDDLYLVNFAIPLGNGTPDPEGTAGNALYRNRGDGTFEDVTGSAGVGLRARGMGAAWGDYDGDGDLDLYVTGYGANVLYRNRGDCTFVDVTEEAGVAGAEAFSAGASWGDHDGDGDLDLYVTNYVRFVEDDVDPEAVSRQFGYAVPFTLNPASYEPAPNELFRNDGGRFVDVAAAVGADNPQGRSLSAAWCDWDEDGDLDLYVANDISDNAFLRNRGDGTFEDHSASTLTADYRGAMGLAVGDYNRDGDLDVFVTHWIAQENALYHNHRMGGAERLLFTDMAELVGLGATALQYVGWGTAFVDYDNDGWPDLFVANGHTFEDRDDPRRLVPQAPQLFWNGGERGFFDVSPVAGPPFAAAFVARGAATSDYDGDGDLDVAVLVHGGAPLLLRNDQASGNHWLQVDLRQPGANPRAVGARIRVEAAGAVQAHGVGATPSYLSQPSLTAHFGLGAADRVERLLVRWPDGEEEAWPEPPVDRRVVVRRGAGVEIR